MPSSIVLIGPADAIPSLRERLSSGAELQTFTDAEAVQALEHIVKTRPTIVALEHEFSATSRGTALIDRVKADPELSSCEIRVIAHDGALSRVATRRSPSGRHIVVEEHELDPTGTRRVPRIQIREGVQVLIDGNPATLLSLSVLGAMVFSSKMLKPNQRVRVTLSDAKGTIRCDGSIIWASFEMPKGESPRYRAGLELMGVDSATLAHSPTATENPDPMPPAADHCSQRAAIDPSRTIVSSRSDPVETIAIGTPLTSSSLLT